MSALPHPSRAPRIVALLPHQGLQTPPTRLAQIVRNAAAEHASQAEVEVIEPELGQLLELARSLEAGGQSDAFICAGAAGHYLRSHLSTPVALLRVNGFDLLAALHEAAQLSDTVAIFSRERAQPEIAAAASLFNLKVVHHVYNGPRDVRKMLDQNRGLGTSVVIGSNMVVQYAQSIGLAGILSVAHHSAHQALDEALVFCRHALVDKTSRTDRRLRSPRSRSRFNARYHLYQLIGASAAMRTCARLAKQYASTDSTVLITGESGTGKEWLAQGIHNASSRNAAPFVAINCAALPETLLESELFGYEEGAFSGSRRGGKPGLIELAHSGTLFLDEIGDMPLALQTRLLRVLQEQEVLRLGGVEPISVNVRIIAATHRDLAARMVQEEFRADLYYRINVLRLHAPPLRDRRDDIPELARHLAQNIAERSTPRADLRTLLDTLMPALLAYAWPGNVRELANVIERAVVSLPTLTQQAVTPDILQRCLPELYVQPPSSVDQPSRNLHTHLQHVAREQARKMLDECDGDHEVAAKRLGISRSTLWRRLKQPADTHANTATKSA